MNSVKFFAGLIGILVIIFTIPVLRAKATLIFSGAGILAAILGFAAQAAISNLIAGPAPWGEGGLYSFSASSTSITGISSLTG